MERLAEGGGAAFLSEAARGRVSPRRRNSTVQPRLPGSRLRCRCKSRGGVKRPGAGAGRAQACGDDFRRFHPGCRIPRGRRRHRGVVVPHTARTRAPRASACTGARRCQTGACRPSRAATGRSAGSGPRTRASARYDRTGTRSRSCPATAPAAEAAAAPAPRLLNRHLWPKPPRARRSSGAGSRPRARACEGRPAPQPQRRKGQRAASSTGCSGSAFAAAHTPNKDASGYHGFQMRHRRPAECRQVHPVQRADATAAAQAANYPFCTIEPNVGEVPVPDARLGQARGDRQVAADHPHAAEFVDIAGLVRGASKGEGLGNQFLANIRETDAIAMCCAASRTTTSSTSRAGRSGRATPRRSTPSWCSPTSRGSRSRDAAAQKKAKGQRQGSEGRARAGRDRARTLCTTASPRASLGRNPGRGAPAVAAAAAPDREAGALRLQRRRGVGRNGNAYSRTVVERCGERRRGSVVISRQDRGRDRAAATPRSARVLWHVGPEEPGLNRLIRAGYACWASSPTSPPARRKCAPGPSTRAPRRRRPPASSTPTSRRASSAPRPSPTRDFMAWAARRREGGRQDAHGRQGLPRAGRRHHALPLRELAPPRRPDRISALAVFAAGSP